MRTTAVVLASLALSSAAACGQEAAPQRPDDNGSAAPVAGASAPVAGASAPAPVEDAAAPRPDPSAGPIAMTAAMHHAILELSFVNTTPDPAVLAARVFGSRLPNYDWLTVTLDGGGASRRLGFIQAREESAIQTVELAPGAAHTERIDLVTWALEAGGAPIAPGTYRVTARWDARAAARGVEFSATATTELVITAPTVHGCESATAATRTPPLALFARQVPGGRALVDVGLYNPGDAAVCVYEYVTTQEVQNDWLTITYEDGNKHHHVARVIAFDDDRDKSAPVATELAPGQTVWRTYDVDAWARRKINGAERLPTGSLYARALYDATRETDAWNGKLASEPFELRVR